MTLTAATSTSGYFQPHPTPSNQWESDATLRRAASLFLPASLLSSQAPNFSSFADRVISPEIFAAGANAEHDLPYIKGSGFTSFGHPNPDSLVTSAGWKALQDFGVREGIVATGYDKSLGASVRIVQLIRLHMWTPSACIATCPMAMQDGAITVLQRDLAHGPAGYDGPSGYDKETLDLKIKVFNSALERLLSKDPKKAWTSGQWMTERPGGSDVAGTETVATREGFNGETDIDGLPLGNWRIDGFKWFSSATDCGCVVLLAKTSKGGLSCFFAPTRKLVNGTQQMNGIRIQRLKNKLGTKALPTAEVEIKGLRAWLVGEEGRGVSVISAVLNNTRYYNAASSVGYVGRGLNVAKSFASVRPFPSRKAPNNLLKGIPLYAKTIATVSLQYRADLLLTMLVAALLGAADTGAPGVPPLVPSDPGDTAALLRLITPVTKAYTAKHSIRSMQECMEALGGVGYMDNVENPEMNLARLFRDANVLAIWEGTTDVLSTDTVKVLKGRTGVEVTRAFDAWVSSVLGLQAHGKKEAPFIELKRAVGRATAALVSDVGESVDELLSRGREVVWRIGDIVCATLLIADAERDGDALAAEYARRFVIKSETFTNPKQEKQRWEEVTRWDRRIAFGDEEVSAKL